MDTVNTDGGSEDKSTRDHSTRQHVRAISESTNQSLVEK